MDALLGILKGVAPVLATAVAGPAGGAAVGWIASKLGIPDDTIEGVTKALTGNPEMAMKLKELDLEYAKLGVYAYWYLDVCRYPQRPTTISHLCLRVYNQCRRTSLIVLLWF
jgi:hypothetical protein